MNSKIRQIQVFQLMNYLPYNLAYFHILYATGGGLYQKLTYPNVNSENFKKSKNNFDLLTEISALKGTAQAFRDTKPTFGRKQAEDNLIIDSPVNSLRDHLVLLPIFSRIINFTGTARSIAPQMYNEIEKQFISEQVDRFSSYGISIKQEKVIHESKEDYISGKNSFGGYRYVIEPNIYSLTKFEEELQTGVVKINSNINYAQVQYLSNAIEKENIERFENLLKLRNGNKQMEFHKNKNLSNFSPNTSHVSRTQSHVSGSSTPNRPRAARLADQMKLLAMASKTQKMDEKKSNEESKDSGKKTLSRAEMWKKFLNTNVTPKHPGGGKESKLKKTKSSSKSSEEYQVTQDPGISNSDWLGRIQKSKGLLVGHA